MIDPASEIPPPSAKIDPETLVLRGAPRPVVRFRRSLIIGLAGAASAVLVAVTWAALEPPGFRLAVGEEGGDPPRRTAPDALANVPATYGDVPRLGPPLPGDLGRPILAHQEELDRHQSMPSEAGAAEAERAREAERQRVLAERDAARTSGILVQLADRGGAARNALAPAARGEEGETARRDAAAPAAARPAAGLAQAGDADGRPSAGSARTLSAGTIIPASLITGLNSDLPGMVLAQVTENVRDSATGRTVLIPQGARLLGTYESEIGFGQRRALLAWQRIVFPDGSSIALEEATATDVSGYAGVEDGVDVHSTRLLKGIALSTLLGVGTEISLGGDENDLVRAVRESAQQNAARAGDRITARNLDIAPTLTVRPGWPVRAILHSDLVLAPWKE